MLMNTVCVVNSFSTFYSAVPDSVNVLDAAVITHVL